MSLRATTEVVNGHTFTTSVDPDDPSWPAVYLFDGQEVPRLLFESIRRKSQVLAKMKAEKP